MYVGIKASEEDFVPCTGQCDACRRSDRITLPVELRPTRRGPFDDPTKTVQKDMCFSCLHNCYRINTTAFSCEARRQANLLQFGYLFEFQEQHPDFCVVHPTMRRIMRKLSEGQTFDPNLLVRATKIMKRTRGKGETKNIRIYYRKWINHLLWMGRNQSRVQKSTYLRNTFTLYTSTDRVPTLADMNKMEVYIANASAKQ
jgi:hypothetical protein